MGAFLILLNFMSFPLIKLAVCISSCFDKCFPKCCSKLAEEDLEAHPDAISFGRVDSKDLFAELNYE